MIKGVNKQVLEINETQNSFFEKAIFFVKPEYSGLSEGRLRESAKKEIESAGYPPRQKKLSLFSWKQILMLAGFFLSGVAIGIFASSAF